MEELEVLAPQGEKQEIIKCERSNRPITYELKVLENRDGIIALASATRLKLVNLMEQKKKIDKELEILKDTILTEMDKNGIYSIDMGSIKITNVTTKPTKTFDKKLFERDNPELYEEYCYYKDGTQSLKITIR